MKQRISFFIILFVLTAFGFAKAQNNAIEKGLSIITKETVQSQLEFLASDWMEGRETSTRGEYMAGDYIASMFKYIGLKPAGDMVRPVMRYTPGQQMAPVKPERGYFQTINFTENLGSESQFELITKDGNTEESEIFNQGSDYNVGGAAVGKEFTAPVVFIGYGLKIDELGINDFKGLNIKGKVVVYLNGFPKEFMDPKSDIYKKLNLGDRNSMWKLYRERQEALQSMGAAAVIAVPGYYNATPENYPFRYNTPYYEGDKKPVNNMIRLSLPEDSIKSSASSITISAKLSSELLKGTGINPIELAKNYVPGKKSIAKELKGKLIHFRYTVKTRTVSGRNVLGMIEGENPNEVIVIGAHYDHCGMYNGYIWNGSDDNASGTVGVMTIARAIIKSGVKPKKTIIFAAWTGEEKGLFGSTYFVDKFRPKENLVLNLNFDMISRKPEKDSTGFKSGMDYSLDYPILKDLVEKANKDYNLDLTMDFRPAKQPQAGTDFSPFAAKNIPIYGFDAAFTADYHGPFDHVEKADFGLMTRIIKAGFVSVFELATSDKKIEPAK